MGSGRRCLLAKDLKEGHSLPGKGGGRGRGMYPWLRKEPVCKALGAESWGGLFRGPLPR